MKIHKIIDHATLEIVLDTIDDDLLSNIHHLEISILILIAVIIDCRVNIFVHLDAATEVDGCGLGILPTIIGASELDVTNIGHDEFFVVAFAFDEHCLDTMFGTSVEYPFSTLLGRICRIKDADDASGAEPSQHVGHSSLCCSFAFPLTLLVADVKKIGCGLGSVIATIVSHVKSLCRDR